MEYEDYTLRLMTDEGIPVPTPQGIVEISPEREYMIVMEFFEGAEEIGDVDVDEGIVDEGLSLVRKLWDAGLAHRDIKPANLMVRDGRVLLIDVFFAQVKPSPWRQAVDLGNMMLVLAVRSDVDLVYRRALTFFTADEIAEAFAATRGIASPTQLRAFMKRDPRDLVGQFRALAPERRPISIQRWSVRRVLLALGMLVAFAIAVSSSINAFLPAQNLGVVQRARVRSEPCVHPLGTGRADGGGDPLSRRSSLRVDLRWRRHPQRRGELLAELRSGRDASGHGDAQRPRATCRAPTRSLPTKPARAGSRLRPASRRSSSTSAPTCSREDAPRIGSPSPKAPPRRWCSTWTRPCRSSPEPTWWRTSERRRVSPCAVEARRVRREPPAGGNRRIQADDQEHPLLGMPRRDTVVTAVLAATTVALLRSHGDRCRPQTDPADRRRVPPMDACRSGPDG